MRKITTLSLFLFFLLVYFPFVNAQLSEGGVPYSYINALPQNVQTVVMPPVDVDKLLAEDKLEEGKDIPYRFGWSIDVNYSLTNSGTWTTFPDGSKLWRLNIVSSGATTMNFVFNDYWLPRGAKFYIYNEQKTEVIGAFTHRNNSEDGSFATGLLRGPSIVMEYLEPAGVESPGIISISNVIHGYKNVFARITERDDFGGSGACNINVNCPVGVPWSNEKRAAGMILTSGGTRVCSGSMINNVRQDLKPYFLTANHCGGSSTWVFMFKYESPNCSNIDGPLNYTISGATKVANNSASDFCLMLLSAAPPDSFEVHYAGFSAVNTPATKGVGIHHPDSDIKKISFSDVPLQDDANIYPTIPGSHWKVFWSTDGSKGITEPGSSGSPIYDQNHRIVGQLHGGPSSCTASDKSDSYGKVSMSWDYGTTPATRLKDWLDPDNTGTRIVDGWDPTMGNPDTVAPTRITNLAVAGPTSSSLTLSWTAPLDTSHGGVQEYDIRRSATPITDTTTFNAAAKIQFTGTIGASGTPQSQVVKNLPFSTTFYFAIRTRDRWNNKSLISNVPTGTTWAAPKITVTPDSMHHTLGGNLTVVDSFIVRNTSTSPSTLDYTVILQNNTFPQGLVEVNMVPLKNESELLAVDKKDNPVNVGGQSIRGGGGPDAFGYKWIDSDDPNGPQYVWDDIVATGTQVTNWVSATSTDPKDDGIAGPFDLGFSMKFYGALKNQISVSTNGILLFNYVTASVYSNASIPAAGAPNEFIAPLWDDLDGRTQGTVHYKQENGRFIIQYTNWQKYSGTGSLTFQVVLYPSGKIMIFYKTLTGANLTQCTVGIENGTGTVGLGVTFNAAYLHDNLAIKFASEPDWISNNNPGGTLINGNSAALKMTFRSEDYLPGDYKMDVMITNNDPLAPNKRVPVTMKISPVPVELASFIADASDDIVVLKWETSTEVNNSGYMIERKLLNDKAVWSELSFVKGAGSTTERKIYSYKDKNLPAGKYSYRLRQVDFDGTIQYSPSAEVEIKSPEKFALMQNYPNPFNPETRIKFSVPVKSQVRIAVYNTLGEIAAEVFNGSMEAGYHELVFSASKLSSGTYFYRIEAGSYVETKKMTILK